MWNSYFIQRLGVQTIQKWLWKQKGILPSLFFYGSESITTVPASIFLFLLFPRWQCRQISLFPAVMGPLLLVIDWQSFQFLFTIFHKIYNSWRFNDLIKYKYPQELCFESSVWVSEIFLSLSPGIVRVVRILSLTLWSPWNRALFYTFSIFRNPSVLFPFKCSLQFMANGTGPRHPGSGASLNEDILLREGALLVRQENSNLWSCTTNLGAVELINVLLPSV